VAGASESSKAIGRAARETLRPLGLVQHGRSRTWLDDHGWWVVTVEFQPSGFSKGSHLNVGVCWLWWPWFHHHLSFDVGHRVEGFVGYRSEEQFDRVAADLAHRAADEVLVLRDRFNSLSRAIDHLVDELERAPMSAWDIWNASMGFALAGRWDDARRAASQSAPPPWMPDWEVTLRAELANVAALDDAEMEHAVRANIAAARAVLRLPEWRRGQRMPTGP
jgi:hypothetical protein